MASAVIFSKKFKIHSKNKKAHIPSLSFDVIVRELGPENMKRGY